jgi:hypothetical protein
MNNLDRFLDWAGSTEWTVSPAMLALACIGSIVFWNRVTSK